MTIIRFEDFDAARVAATDETVTSRYAEDRHDNAPLTAPLPMVTTEAVGHAEPVGAPEPSPVGEFLEQFDVAAPGEFVAYHVGDLASDCEVGDGARDIRACKAVAMGLFEDRDAHLVQRRFGPHRYVYYAVKR